MTHSIYVGISDADYDYLARIAKNMGVEVSEVVRRMVTDERQEFESQLAFDAEQLDRIARPDYYKREDKIHLMLTDLHNSENVMVNPIFTQELKDGATRTRKRCLRWLEKHAPDRIPATY